MRRKKGSKNKSTLEKEELLLNQEQAKREEENKQEKVNFQENNLTKQEIPAKSLKPKKEKEYYACQRCGATIYCEPRKIDTNLITGMADYYRTAVRYVKLCDRCCKELSALIDGWLLDADKGGNPELNKWLSFGKGNNNN